MERSSRPRPQPSVPKARRAPSPASAPALGDRILVGGRYIVDCGRPDLHTELHPISFLAWSHVEGARTVVHLYSHAYRDTQLYSPDLAVTGQVNNTSRLAGAKSIVPDLIDQVVGMISGKVNRLQFPELVEAIQPPIKPRSGKPVS